MASTDARKGRARISNFLKENALVFALIVSMGVGIGLGLGLRSVISPTSTREIMYLRFAGDLLMRMLKFLILPLVVSSLIVGVASLGNPGKIGLRAIVYYAITTLIAVILGIVLVVSIQPGYHGSRQDITNVESKDRIHPADALMDILRSMFPDNLVTACFQQVRTIEQPSGSRNESVTDPVTNITNVTVITEYSPVSTYVSGINILGLVVFSIACGVVIGRMKQHGDVLIDFFTAVNDVTMSLVSVVIWYSPIGVCFLIAAQLVSMSNIEVVMAQLGLYAATVLAGLAIHSIIILPLLYLVVVRKNPFKFGAGVIKAMITALGTSSSSATLPVTFDCLENNVGLEPRITRFVLPIGATVNMDGTALYEAVAAIFIAQLNRVPLDAGKIITISVTATLASIGAAGIPSAGLVTLIIVLTAVGLPTQDIGLIVAIDWFLDRFRTMVNVWGDSVGAGIVNSLSRKELQTEGGPLAPPIKQSNDTYSSETPIDGYDNYALTPDMDKKGINAEANGILESTYHIDSQKQTGDTVSSHL